MRSYHCSGLEKDCIPNSTACSSRVRISPFRWRSRDNRSKPHGRKSTRSCGRVFRSSRPRIGGSGIARCRKRISSGNRTGIDLLYCSEEPRTLPITWGRRLWRGQRPRLGPCCKNRARLQQSDANQSTSQSSISSSRGNAMTPREFQKSHLAVELKAGRKRLEDALHGLSDEQCERAGATRSGSVVDLLSEIVTKEFLALMELSDRLPSLLMSLLANTDGRTPTVSGAEKDATNKSVETLLAEFGVLRSAVIRRIEGRKPQGAEFDAKHAYVADVCVTRFNEQIDEI